MPLFRNVARGLRSLFRKEQVSQELDEELKGFLEMAAEEKMKHGMSRKDALRAVRLERGSPEVTKEVVGSAGWESFVEVLDVIPNKFAMITQVIYRKSFTIPDDSQILMDSNPQKVQQIVSSVHAPGV